MARVAQVQIPREDAVKLVAMFGQKRADQIMFVAVRRATERAKTAVADLVESRLTIPKKYITGTNRRAAVSSRVSTGADPVGIINVKKVALPLFAFADKRVTKRGGVSVTPERGKSPIVLRHAFKARVQSLSQLDQGVSHVGIFQRRRIGGSLAKFELAAYGRVLDAATRERFAKGGYGPGTSSLTPSSIRNDRPGAATPRGYAWRLPIEEAMGPSILDLIARPDITDAAVKTIAARLSTEVDGQVSRFTKGKYKTLDAAWAAYQLTRRAV